MAGKSNPERIERLEADYAFTREAFTEIRDQLIKINGSIIELNKFRIQVATVLAVVIFAVSSAGGVIGFLEFVN